MSEAIQVLPEGGVRAMDGETMLDIRVEAGRVQVRMWRPGMFDQSMVLSPPTLGFFLGALLRLLDPDNLAGLRRPEEAPDQGQG